MDSSEVIYKFWYNNDTISIRDTFVAKAYFVGLPPNYLNFLKVFWERKHNGEDAVYYSNNYDDMNKRGDVGNVIRLSDESIIKYSEVFDSTGNYKRIFDFQLIDTTSIDDEKGVGIAHPYRIELDILVE